MSELWLQTPFHQISADFYICLSSRKHALKSYIWRPGTFVVHTPVAGSRVPASPSDNISLSYGITLLAVDQWSLKMDSIIGYCMLSESRLLACALLSIQIFLIFPFLACLLISVWPIVPTLAHKCLGVKYQNNLTDIHSKLPFERACQGGRCFQRTFYKEYNQWKLTWFPSDK